MICARCGRVAPTRAVTFRQNVGMLVVRSTRVYAAELCRDCLGAVCRHYSLVTAVAGWWGIISLVVTPLYLAQNAWQFWTSRDLARPAPDAETALAVAERTRPLVLAQTDWINQQFERGCGLPEVARLLAEREGLDPVAVEVTLRLLAKPGRGLPSVLSGPAG